MERCRTLARSFGIGRQTGVDLGAENAGNLPTPTWRAARDQLEVQCEHATGPFAGRPRHSAAGSPTAARGRSATTRTWPSARATSQATPLQLAVAYSAIANGGTVVRPHVGLEVDAPDGTVLQRIDPAPARHIAIAAQNLDAIRSGLHGAASQAGGTSADVFPAGPRASTPCTARPEPPSGRTGRPVVVCLLRARPQRPILVAVTVEQGGFGAAAAAPAARQILSQWFFGKRGQFIAGTSKTL